jgi:membrane protease YdiL (CAAX protease family)
VPILATLAVPRLSLRPSAPPRQRIPSPLQACLLWLFTMVLVIGAGVLVSVVAAGVAVGTGLSVERAIAILLDPMSSPLVTSASWISISLLVSEAVVALVIWRFLRRHRLFLREVCPLRVPSLRDTIGALLCVFGLAPLAGMLAELAQRYFSRDVNAETMVVALSRNVSPRELIGVVLATALVPGIVEELLFRGVLTRAFVGRSNLLAVFVPSLMFALFHLEPTQAAGSFVIGVGLAIVRLYTDSVITSMLCHLAYNSFELIDVYAGGPIGSTELHLGRVGLGLSISAIGFILMVLHPGERRR